MNTIDKKNIYNKDENEEQNSDMEKENKDDLFTKLLNSRKIIISDSISSKTADRVMKQLLIMNDIDNEKPITIIINSPGGEMYSGFGIYDMISFIDAPVKTVICGLAASMGSIISISADKENRFATPNSRIMIHQPLLSGIMGGSITDIEIEAAEMLDLKQRVVDLYVEKTGQSEKKIRQVIERNTWMTAKQALEFGHISKIINSISELD